VRPTTSEYNPTCQEKPLERKAVPFLDSSRKVNLMARQENGRIVETPTEARQAEPGPSVLVLLTTSLGLAIIILGAVYLIFFKT
jgi:hypothetical protein